MLSLFNGRTFDEQKTLVLQATSLMGAGNIVSAKQGAFPNSWKFLRALYPDFPVVSLDFDKCGAVTVALKESPLLTE